MSHHLILAAPLILAGVLAASDDIAPGMNRFAASAYQQLAPAGGNLVLSPFSISTALSMLLAGARGQTAAGISAVLSQKGSAPDYHAAVAALGKELNQQGNAPGNQLSIANGLWVQKGFPLAPPFEKTIREVYGAPLTPLDFHAEAERAREEINSWTAQKTKNRIQGLFGQGAIDAGTRLVLTSAVYFYGKWLMPFDPDATKAEPFHSGGGRPVDAKFMHQTANFLYGETAGAQILEMKYAGTPLVFDVVLPKALDGLPQVEKALQHDSLPGWLRGLVIHHVDTAIPKFRVESSFSLREMLSRLGMADAFGDSADFSGIDGRRDLCVSSVVHKAFVDVAERGTEAAAATGVAVRPLAMRRRDEAVFRADHPFLFFIRDSTSGVILFEGRLIDQTLSH